jgi:hypothetical protein
MALHPVAVPALQIGEQGLGVAVWGEELSGSAPRLRFWPYGVQTKWIDVFTTGAPGMSFTVTAEDWIEVSEVSGMLTNDRRIDVRIPDVRAAAGRSGVLTIEAAGQRVQVAVEVAPLPSVSPEFTGSIEADGYVSLDASRPDAVRPTTGSTWETVNWLGRDGNAVLEARGGAGARVEYGICLATPGEHLLELYRLPTLNSTGQIRLAVSVDQAQPMTVAAPTTDEYRGVWTQAVLDNVERISVRLPHLDTGEHVLRLHAIDEDVAVSKLVIYTAPRVSTNLGPPFSHHTDRPLTDGADPDPALVSFDRLDAIAREVYRTDPAGVPVPSALFTRAPYSIKGRCLAVPQDRLGARRPLARPDGTKDVLAELPSGPAFEADGTIRIEAESALAGPPGAWTTPSLDGSVTWTHLNAETDAGTGLAMWVDAPGARWTAPEHAPGLHYAVGVENPGRYHVWLLVKFNHTDDDACWVAVDGVPLPPEEQMTAGQLFRWDLTQRWHWALLCDLDLDVGPHTLSILAREAGLRVDRLYLTTGDELPPMDADWTPMTHEDDRDLECTLKRNGHDPGGVDDLELPPEHLPRYSARGKDRPQ